MTEARWEYASVVWTETARKITRVDPEFERLSPEVHEEWSQKEWPFYWWKVQKYYIWLPGVTEPDVRLSWETGEDDYRVNFLDILNELGAQGWELASNLVASTAMGPSLGRETTGFPIRTQTVLKRQAMS
jgi:hypothetical protein